MNAVQGWLRLIGSKDRARTVRSLLHKLGEARMVAIAKFGGEEGETMLVYQPGECPIGAAFGLRASQLAYADPELRPALDAWDRGEVTKVDVKRYCLEIEQGNDARNALQNKRRAKKWGFSNA